MLSRIFKKTSKENANSIETLTLADLWIKSGMPKVKIIKIDTEGYERLVLQSGIKFLKNGLALAAVIEVSEWSKVRCGISYNEVYKIMELNGFIYLYYSTPNYS